MVAARLVRRVSEAFQRGAEALEIAGAARTVGRFRHATLEEAMDFGEQFEYGEISIRPMQIRGEIRSFLELVASDPPRAVLEIGTGRGGTLFLLAHTAREDACLVSVDSADAEGGFGGRPSYGNRSRLYRALGRSGQRVVFLAADSHLSETRARVEAILAGNPLDLLFIDGDHTRVGIESDFRMYSPLVRAGGLIAFHDIVPGPPEAVGAVPAFWQDIRSGTACGAAFRMGAFADHPSASPTWSAGRETRANGECLEFVESWSQGCCGIGVLRLT